MKKYSIGDYIISQDNRKGNNGDNVYMISASVAYEYFFSIIPGEKYPTCIQNVDNLIKVTSIIISTWANKRLFSGVLVNGKLDVGQDNRTYTIVRNLIDSALIEKKYEIDTLYNTTILEYNPIENYNSTEKETTTLSGSEIDTKSGSEIHSRTGNDSTTYTGGTTTTPTGSTSVTRKETAFNEPTDLATSTQDITSYEGMTTSEVFKDRADTNSHDETETATYNNLKNERTYNNRKNERTFERKGNIGVTTSQQMLEQERSIALFSVWQHIANIVQESITTSEWLSPDRKECDYEY